MNTFSDILTRIPFLSICFAVALPPYKVIEQLQSAIAAQQPIESETEDFFYNADFEDHTFLIQSAYIKRYKGKVLVPDRSISYWRAYDPVSMDQTPIFHGMVLRHGYGDEAIIKGHFGVGTPFYLALLAFLPIILFLLLRGNFQYFIPISALFLFRAVLSIFQFKYERKRIKNFLLSVFQDSIYRNNSY